MAYVSKGIWVLQGERGAANSGSKTMSCCEAAGHMVAIGTISTDTCHIISGLFPYLVNAHKHVAPAHMPDIKTVKSPRLAVFHNGRPGVDVSYSAIRQFYSAIRQKPGSASSCFGA